MVVQMTMHGIQALRGHLLHLRFRMLLHLHVLEMCSVGVPRPPLQAVFFIVVICTLRALYVFLRRVLRVMATCRLTYMAFQVLYCVLWRILQVQSKW